MKHINHIPTEALKTMEAHPTLEKIRRLDSELLDHFSNALVLDKSLTRQIVSFQANKSIPVYRWYKFKEAFSCALVERFLPASSQKIKVLDPFAGSGTTLFSSAALGHDAHGIELLPIGQKIISTRMACEKVSPVSLVKTLTKWSADKPWETHHKAQALPVLRITEGAYPNDTLASIERYMGAISTVSRPLKDVLELALLCVLEDVSYTRKDGQYLRWDYRAKRKRGSSKFAKPDIKSFDRAISDKISQICNDLKNPQITGNLFEAQRPPKGSAVLSNGSCIDILPSLETGSFQRIITSPPYCNRYDYTRTYALEHALLGVNDIDLVKLRQNMLSCTVENRAKDLLAMNIDWKKPIQHCDDLPILQEIISYLDFCKESGTLNNNGIPRMVRGYFYEMACIIHECYRVLEGGGQMVMVNDNVRYAGLGISVDTILSKLAESTGFKITNIYVSPQNKGNSSQQMGAHGREALRKSVYVWEK